jgi:hypothetical protein
MGSKVGKPVKGIFQGNLVFLLLFWPGRPLLVENRGLGKKSLAIYEIVVYMRMCRDRS